MRPRMRLCNDNVFDCCWSSLTILWIPDPIIRHNCTYTITILEYLYLVWLCYLRLVWMIITIWMSVSCITLLSAPSMANNNNLNVCICMTLLFAPSMIDNDNLRLVPLKSCYFRITYFIKWIFCALYVRMIFCYLGLVWPNNNL